MADIITPSHTSTIISIIGGLQYKIITAAKDRTVHFYSPDESVTLAVIDDINVSLDNQFNIFLRKGKSSDLLPGILSLRSENGCLNLAHYEQTDSGEQEPIHFALRNVYPKKAKGSVIAFRVIDDLVGVIEATDAGGTVFKLLSLPLFGECQKLPLKFPSNEYCSLIYDSNVIYIFGLKLTTTIKVQMDRIVEVKEFLSEGAAPATALEVAVPGVAPGLPPPVPGLYQEVIKHFTIRKVSKTEYELRDIPNFKLRRTFNVLPSEEVIALPIIDEEAILECIWNPATDQLIIYLRHVLTGKRVNPFIPDSFDPYCLDLPVKPQLIKLINKSLYLAVAKKLYEVSLIKKFGNHVNTGNIIKLIYNNSNTLILPAEIYKRIVTNPCELAFLERMANNKIIKCIENTSREKIPEIIINLLKAKIIKPSTDLFMSLWKFNFQKTCFQLIRSSEFTEKSIVDVLNLESAYLLTIIVQHSHYERKELMREVRKGLKATDFVVEQLKKWAMQRVSLPERLIRWNVPPLSRIADFLSIIVDGINYKFDLAEINKIFHIVLGERMMTTGTMGQLAALQHAVPYPKDSLIVSVDMNF